jgi:hypothetical protein
MKPQNNHQRYIEKIDSGRPKFTKAIINWALKKHFMHRAIQLKSGSITCLDCAHQWKATYDISSVKNNTRLDILRCEPIYHTRCPNCKEKVGVVYSLQKIGTHYQYISKFAIFKGFQLYQEICITVCYHKGKKRSVYKREMGTLYMKPGERTQYMGPVCRETYWGLNVHSGREIRNQRNVFKNLLGYHHLWPKSEYHPIINKIGYYETGLGEIKYMSGIMNPKGETLLKAGYVSLFKHLTKMEDKYYLIERYWTVFRHLMKKGIVIKNRDISSYFDYLEMLRYIGKNPNSPELAAVENWHEKHQQILPFVIRKQKREAVIRFRKKRIDEILRLGKEKLLLEEHTKLYTDLKIISGSLCIVPILSEEQMEQESIWLEHCAYSSNYHKNYKFLMLSARVKGIVVETIQFNLSTFKPNQIRGWDNKPSKYNKRVLKIMETKGAQLIRKAQEKHRSKNIQERVEILT